MEHKTFRVGAVDAPAQLIEAPSGVLQVEFSDTGALDNDEGVCVQLDKSGVVFQFQDSNGEPYGTVKFLMRELQAFALAGRPPAAGLTLHGEG